MKPLVILALLLSLSSTVVFGQIKIGDNPQNIDVSSVLELESTNRVLVITRVNNLEMESIAPLRGGLVYNTDTQCLHYFNGTEWINLCDAVSFSLTNDPIVNTRSTISITDNGGTINLEVAPNSIRSENIVDGGINGDDIQDNSIGESKLGADSVSANELRDNSVGSAEVIDGTIRPVDIANAVPNQILITDINGIVAWDDAANLQGVVADEVTITGSGTPTAPLTLTEAVTTNITDNTVAIASHIAADTDTDDQNEVLTEALLDGDELVLIESGNETRIDLGVLNNAGTDEQTIATDNTPGNISIINGNEILLNINDADANPNNEIQNINEVLIDGNDAGGNLVKNIGTPVDNQDAATKAYVDGAITALQNNKEDVANKSDNVALGNSPNLYPTQNAVKVYVDNIVGGSAQTIVSSNTPNSIEIGTDGGALYDDPDNDATNEIQNISEVLIDGNDAGGNLVKNIGTPVDNQDAATKAYVDGAITGVGGTIVSTLPNNNIIDNLGAFYDDPDNDAGNEIQNLGEVLIDGNDAGGQLIKNMADPIDPQDAATRAYVLANSGGTNLSSLPNNDLIENSGIFYDDPDNNAANEIQNLGEVLTDGNDGAGLLIKNIANPVDPQDAATRAYVLANSGGSQNLSQVLAQGNNAGGIQIENLIDPDENQDAATKKYVDDSIIASGGGIPTDELITAFNLSATTLTITEDGIDWTEDLSSLEESAEIAINILEIDNLKDEQIIQNNAIILNTAKIGVTPAQAAILANTSGTNTGDQDISGIAINTGAIAANDTDILDLQNEQVVQNDAIALNSAKTGISPAQATILANTSGTNTGDQDISGIAINATAITANDTDILDLQNEQIVQNDAIALNTAKTSLTPEQATTIGNTSGTNTGDQDISGIAINTTAITANDTDILNLQNEQVTQNDAIALNTAKTSLTPAQATTIGNTSGTNTGDQDISGIAINATDIDVLEAEQITQNDAIAINTAKTSITPAQATIIANTSGTNSGDQDISGIAINATDIDVLEAEQIIQNDAIALNTAKTNITPAQATVIANTSGTNSGDQDISGIAINATAIALKEDTSNKSTDITLADATNTLFPTELAVKTYVDNSIITGTSGSIFFANDIDGTPSENNAQLFWDTNENKLFVGPQIATLPEVKLNVNGATRTQGIRNSNGTAGLPSYRFNNNGDTGMFLADASGILGFATNNNEAIRINAIQNVGIGPTFDTNGTPIAARLHVDGNIRAEGTFEASGTITESVPDYVFQKYFTGTSSINDNYKFQSLQDIENFVKQNQHLPGVQSADAIKRQGYWNLGEASRINLEKIEELFLHTIEQEKKINELRRTNEAMATEMELLKTQLEEIKKMVLAKDKN